MKVIATKMEAFPGWYGAKLSLGRSIYYATSLKPFYLVVDSRWKRSSKPKMIYTKTERGGMP